MYINTELGTYPITESQIRAANPNTSFGQPFVAPEPYKVVFPAPAPAYDPLTQYPAEDAPALTAKGHWEQQWLIIDLTEEQIAANAAAAKAIKDADIKAQIAALDLRRIRPLAEGDTAYLADLNAQIVALRGQL